MITTLTRFPLIAPYGSLNNEPTPPIGLAYIASSCKKKGVVVKGIDSTGQNLDKIFKIYYGNLQGNGIEINEVLKLIDPKTKIFGISVMFSHEWTYIKNCIKILKKNFPKSIIITGGEHDRDVDIETINEDVVWFYDKYETKLSDKIAKKMRGIFD